MIESTAFGFALGTFTALLVVIFWKLTQQAPDYRFNVFQGIDGKWYWDLKAGNNEIVAQSEGYVSKWNAERAIRILSKELTKST